MALQCAYLLDPNLLVRRCLPPTDWSDLTTSISQHSPGVGWPPGPGLTCCTYTIINTAVYLLCKQLQAGGQSCDTCHVSYNCYRPHVRCWPELRSTKCHISPGARVECGVWLPGPASAARIEISFPHDSAGILMGAPDWGIFNLARHQNSYTLLRRYHPHIDAAVSP